MFCRYCGQANDNSSIYCSNDGALLYKGKTKVNLVRDKVRFCKECGEGIESYDLYCTDCGASLYEKKRKPPIIEIPNIKDAKIPKIKDNVASKLNLKSSFIYSLIGFGIIFLISVIISSTLNFAIKDALMSEFGVPMDIKILNPMDITLLFNLANLKLSMGVDLYNIGMVRLTGTPVVALLVPFIIFFLMGIVLGRKDNKQGQAFNLQGTLVMGIFYGILLSLFALINSRKTSFLIPYIGEEIILEKSYFFLSTLINGGIISIISLLLGYGVYWKFSKNYDLVGNFKWLFDGLFILFSGALVVSVATGFFTTFVLKETSSNSFMDFTIISQMGIYAFLLINFGSFSFAEDFLEDKVSLFKNMDFIKDGLGSKAPIFLYIAVLVPIVLFYLYGKKAKENGNKNIIYTTITYSVAIGILAYITHGMLVGTGDGGGILDDIFSANFNIGFKIMYSIVGSFILSTLSTLAGFFLTKDVKSEVPKY
jgi:hypothetical protein